MESGFEVRRFSLLVIIIIPLTVRSDLVGGTVFVERGRKGVLPCPLIESGKYATDNTEAMYWYRGAPQRQNLLISHFDGQVAPKNGIPEGVYDIDDRFGLVILNVTEPYDQTYFHFKYKPKSRVVEDGHVLVSEKVCPKPPSPSAIACDQRFSQPAACQELNPFGASSTISLICIVHNAKPPVNITWLRLMRDGQEEVVHHTMQTFNTSFHPARNTFTSSAALRLASANESEVYMCEATGVALPGTSREIVSLSTIQLAEPHPRSSTLAPYTIKDDRVTGTNLAVHRSETIALQLQVSVLVLCSLLTITILTLTATVVKLKRMVFQSTMASEMRAKTRYACVESM